MTKAIGLDQVKALNDFRTDVSNRTYRKANTLTRTGLWLGHKAVSVICIPANLIAMSFEATGMALSLSGMVLSACTIGALKIVIYVVTGGSHKSKWQTGFFWLGKRMGDCGKHLGKNLAGLLINVGELVYDGVRVSLYDAPSFILGRLKKGYEKTCEREPEIESFMVACYKVPDFFRPLNDMTAATRIDVDKVNFFYDRTFTEIGKHILYSFANIPVNAVAGIVSLLVTPILAVAFVGKVLTYAGTNIDIPLPTFVKRSFTVYVATFVEVSSDCCVICLDSTVSVYKVVAKVAKVTRLSNVLAGVGEFLCFIPKAIAPQAF